MGIPQAFFLFEKITLYRLRLVHFQSCCGVGTCHTYKLLNYDLMNHTSLYTEMRIILIGEIRMTRNKIAIAIALFLMFSMFSTLIAIPPSAQVIKMYSFIHVQPNPVGVGQTVTIYFQLDKVPPLNWANGQVSGEYWQNITINVEKPDGTKETLGPYESQSQGASYIKYVPTQIGNYTFQVSLLDKP